MRKLDDLGGLDDLSKVVSSTMESNFYNSIFELLSKADKIALQERIKMFEKPDKYEILVDGRNIID